MSCDVGEVKEQSSYIVIVIAELILQSFRHFTDVTTHSPTLPSLYLRHSSFSNLSVASPISQFIIQPLFRFSYVTSSSFASPTSQALLSLPLRHKLFFRFTYVTSSSFASPTSQALLSLLLRHKLFFRFSYVTTSSFVSPT